MPSESGYVDVDGRKLYYKVDGKGVPVLIISYVGTTAHERLFSSQLRESIRLIFPDQGGVEGLSEPRPIEEITMDLIMKEIEAVRQDLHLDKLAVLGHSAWVKIALEYAIRYPSRTSHLILTPNTGPKYDPAYSRKHETKHWEKYASKERKMLLEKNLKELGDISFFDDFGRWYVVYGPRFWIDPYFDSSHIF